MGNWRFVNIEGTCDLSDVPALRASLTVDRDYTDMHALSNTGGLAGLPDWSGERISAQGNLAERGYDEECVLECLEGIAKKAPSLAVRIHMGGDNEGRECVATVTLVGGKATVGKPGVETLADAPDSQVMDNMRTQMTRQRLGG